MEGSVGSIIKAKRKSRKITLQMLAEATDLSAGYLSMLERDITSPTISNLHKICGALGTTLIDLLSEAEKNRVLIRKDERNAYYREQGNLLYETLVDGNRSIKCTCLTVSDMKEHVSERHVADEFGIVLSGSLALTVGDTVYEMNEGDSIYITANEYHSYRKTCEQTCVSLWVSPSSQQT